MATCLHELLQKFFRIICTSAQPIFTGTRSSIIPTMITTFGMKDGMYSDQIIAKIDMDALF
ncbi:MAG: hypothetical protein IJE12_03890 [Prevotella sp.]|nr:hypothetical protein [Prevotella sp.]